MRTGWILHVAVIVAVVELAGGSAARAEERVVSASVDRIEEGAWIVLDAPPHPSLLVPLRLAPGSREGDAVAVRVAVADGGDWIVRERLDGVLTLADGRGSFRWPASLAPEARPGERMRVAVAPDPARAARIQSEIEALRRTLAGP